MQKFGNRDQLIADVGAFQEEAWAIARDREGRNTDNLRIGDRAPYAKVLTGGGMSIDIGKQPTSKGDSRQAHVKFDKGSLLNTEVTFDELVKEGKLEGSVVDGIKAELKEQLGGVLELALVVVDNRTAIARTDELNPFVFTGYMDEKVEEHKQRCESAVAELRALGATLDSNNIGFMGLGPKALNLLTSGGSGYRIVGRSPNIESNANFLDFPWHGLHNEATAKGAGAIHSMEGERSNIVRAVILEGVRRRLQSCLS